jgi:hypothetical protein
MSRKGHFMTSIEACTQKVSYPTNYIGKEAAQVELARMKAEHGTSADCLVVYQCDKSTPSERHLHLGRHALLR